MNSLTLPSPNPLIPRRILFGNPEKDSPKLSPDGIFLAYLAPDSRGTLNVWVRRAGQKDDQIRRPLLIAQGANDPRVKKTESDQIVEAMRKNRKPVDYLVFPDEGHGFARPDNRLKFYAAAEEFLARYLGGRVEPAGAGENWEELAS